MGLLVNGVWEDVENHADAAEMRNKITNEESNIYKIEPNRYYLYIGLSCPFSHRAYLMWKLKNLENTIGLNFVDPVKGLQGFEFSEEFPDHLNGFTKLHQLYTQSNPSFTGRISVPVLWDTTTKTIVNNDSSDIMIMLNSDFHTENTTDYYPEDLRSRIDELNLYLLKINFGVYKAGLAKTQQEYEQEVDSLFAALDHIEERLNIQRFLLGNQITASD